MRDAPQTALQSADTSGLAMVSDDMIDLEKYCVNVVRQHVMQLAASQGLLRGFLNGQLLIGFPHKRCSAFLYLALVYLNL